MDRLVRAMSIAIVIFAVVIAFIVGSRIDQTTVAMLGGTVVGILVAAPAGALVTFALMRRRTEASQQYDRVQRPTVPLPQNPPQYWVLPPQMQPDAAYMQARLNTTQSGAPAWQMGGDGTQYLPRPRRRFYVIGESGEVRDLEQPGNSGTPAEQYEYEESDPGSVF
jgi:hypothetical protein